MLSDALSCQEPQGYSPTQHIKLLVQVNEAVILQSRVSGDFYIVLDEDGEIKPEC